MSRTVVTLLGIIVAVVGVSLLMMATTGGMMHGMMGGMGPMMCSG